MTADQKAVLRRLAQFVTFPYASYDKRFVRSLRPELDLSDKQAAYLLKLDHRYRRQTSGAHVCAELCATYGRRQPAECFEAPLHPKPVKKTKADATFLRSIGVAPDAPLPLFDGPER